MSGKLQLKKVGWWHERLADLMIAHPERNIKSFAEELDCHPQYLYMIKNSDVFIDYWQQRSQAHSNAVTAALKDKAFGLAEMAVEAISERVARDAEILPLPALLDVLDVTMKRFGYSSDKNAQGPTINFNFPGMVTSEQLASARAKMRETPVKQIDITPEKSDAA